MNGRIIVGGYGRKHPKEADVFLRLALRVSKDVRYVEPQFTLRITKDMPEDIFDMAMESLGAGATYPTLYNDDVNVPAVARAMRVDMETAEQYVPFGCGEFVIAGQSTGTPNTCINLLKLLTIALNEGVDPMDGIKKSGPVPMKPAEHGVGPPHGGLAGWPLRGPVYESRQQPPGRRQPQRADGGAQFPRAL